jgi:hypothetical protein
MPTIFIKEGFRFFFFSNEGNEPPHVHVELADGYAKYWLDPISLAQSIGFNARPLRRIRILVDANREDILKTWYDHFN